jgi:hypothetical protein
MLPKRRTFVHPNVILAETMEIALIIHAQRALILHAKTRNAKTHFR